MPKSKDRKETYALRLKLFLSYINIQTPDGMRIARFAVTRWDVR